MRLFATAVALLALTPAASAERTTFAGAAAIRAVGLHGTSWQASGVVLSASGDVLTTNDVVRGATAFTVDVGGQRYRAHVAGYDVQADVAVLKLEDAFGLRVAPLGNSALVSAGAPVTAYGGLGRKIFGISGRVLLPQQDFVEENADGSDGLHFRALISHDAPLPDELVGGPLVTSSGKVIGINAIGRAEVGVEPRGLEGAIPINRARSIAAAISVWKSNGHVHVGPTAFLGMTLAPGELYHGLTTGVTVVSVVAGSPLAQAGVTRGDIVQSFAGELVTSPDDLTSLLVKIGPGTTVHVVWIGPAGGEHEAYVVLVEGPAQ